MRSVLSVALIFALGCGAGAPIRSVKVGYAEREFADAERRSWKADQPWPLPAAIWYPARSQAKEARFTIGPPGAPFLDRGWVARDAAISTEAKRLPLVLLSHGTGGERSDLSWLAEPLVEAGYLVAAVTHHGNSIQHDDLTVQGFFLFWERAREMSVLLDHLLEDPDFGSRIDRGRIGVAGFSLGGNTTTLLAGARLDTQAYYSRCQQPDARASSCRPPPESPFTVADLEALVERDERTRASIASADRDWRDSRVRAAYAIAPAVLEALDRGSIERIEIPVRVVVGDRDTLAPVALNARPFSEALPRSRLLVLPGVDHYTFIGECGWAGRLLLGEICEERAEVSRRDTLDRVSRDAVAFFDESLRYEGRATAEGD